MIVTDLKGQSELLTDYTGLEMVEIVNGERSLSFTTFQTDNNEYSYPLVQEESKIEYDGQTYVIKSLTENSRNDSSVKTVQAEHIFFGLIDHYVYNNEDENFIDEDMPLYMMVQDVLHNTGYTFTVQGTFDEKYFETFGPGNCLDLINQLCEIYKAEVELDNKHITFKNRIGLETDFQFRYRHNTKSISREVSTANLSTVIVGYYDGDHDTPYEYRSSMVDVYGVKVAEPIYADEVEELDELMELLRDSLNDVPEVTYTLEVDQLKKQGFSDDFQLGDTVYTIWEPLGIDIRTRIVEITRYPESNKSPVVTISNVKRKGTDILADFGRTKANVDKILTDKNTIRFSAMDEQIKKSTKALINSMTELEYPENGGIIGRSRIDPDQFVMFNSGGIGIFKNGIPKEAITVDGFNLSAGVIGKLTALNIDFDTISAGDVGARPYDWNPAYGDITGLKPPTNADNTFGTIGPSRLTSIDANGIYTGTLTAQQINAVQGIVLGANASIQWANLPTLPNATQVGAEEQIIKQSSAPPHKLNRLWLDISVTPEILYRSSGSVWYRVTPTTASDVGAKSSSYNAFDDIGYNRLTSITSAGIYTGTINANQINTVGLKAQELEMTNSFDSSRIEFNNRELSPHTGEMGAIRSYSSNRSLRNGIIFRDSGIDIFGGTTMSSGWVKTTRTSVDMEGFIVSVKASSQITLDSPNVLINNQVVATRSWVRGEDYADRQSVNGEIEFIWASLSNALSRISALESK